MKFCLYYSKDIERKQNLNEILTSVKGLKFITNVQKMMCNNPNLYFVNINAYTKFGEILSVCSKDIEQKQYYDRWTDAQGKTICLPILTGGDLIR